eukprot:48093_1
MNENSNLNVQITSQIINTEYDQEENETPTPPINLSQMSKTESITIKRHCVMCKNIYCCIGAFVSLLALFLLMVSCFYAFGQVSTLEVENFFCPEISLNEVHEHSIQYGLNKGADESTCYKTKYFRLDENKLFHVNQYDVIYILSTLNIVKSSLWCFIVVFNVFLLIAYVILIIIDCHKYSYNKSVSILQQNNYGYGYEHEIEDNKSCCKCSKCCNNTCCTKISELYFRYYRWYRKYFGEDQLGWLIMLVLKEYTEILLQIQALFVYSGYNLFSNKIELGKRSDVVNFFTIILCSNCVLCGLLWFIYAAMNKRCSGLFFKHLVFVIDTIFDTFYAIFPLLIEYKENNYNLAVALGAVNFQSVGAFAAAFIPMLYVSFKCAIVIYSTRKRMKKQIYEYLNLNFQPSTLQLTHVPTHSSTFTSTKFQSATNLDIDSDSDTDTLLRNKSCCAKQRLYVICISIAFFITGISLFLWVSTDISNSEEYCLFPDTDTIEKHPNLLLYNSECEYKVYPLGVDFPCQCRSAQITFYSDYYINDNNMSYDEAAEYQSEIIQSILSDWTMLESITFEGDSNLIDTYFNWNDKKLYNLYQLRIIRFKQNVILSNISSYISNLKRLDVLWVEHAQPITAFPDEMSQLSNLRILILENIVQIHEIPKSFCQLTNLRALKLFYHFDSVPACFSNLQKLETVQIAFLEYIPPEILALPNLNEIGLYFSTFTASDLLDKNDTETQLEYNKNAVYFFTYSTICDEYNSNDVEIHPSVHHFIKETNACQVQCNSTVGSRIDKTFFARDLLCFPWLYQDGVCHDACNKEICGWDGGDCNQLCGDECNIYESFGNGECNNACNSTECDWDGLDCLVIDESACESHGCDISWINDDICDKNCNNMDCYFDEGDCDENCKGNICDEVYYIYSLAANIIPDDKIQYNELCTIWPLVYAQAQLWGVDEWPLTESNCTIVFNFYDKDKDESVTVSELMNEYAHRVGILKNKLDQIDCSMCVDLDFL